MLSNQDIYFSIETNLQTALGYTYRRVEFEEYDDVINSIVNKEIEEIVKKQVKTSFEDRILSELEIQESFEINTKDSEHKINVDFETIHSSSSYLINTKCTGTAIEVIQEDKYYFAPSKVKYNGKWVDYFIGKDNPSFYTTDKVVNAIIKEKQNIVLNPIEYSIYKTRKLYSPIITIQDKVLKIFTNTYSIIEVFVNHYKSFENIKIDNCNDKTLNFSETIQRYFIEKAVLKLSIIINKEQQQINNLISEK